MNQHSVGEATGAQTFIIASPPKYAGMMELFPRFSVSVTKRPALLHRLMMRWLLGWKWKPISDQAPSAP